MTWLSPLTCSFTPGARGFFGDSGLIILLSLSPPPGRTSPSPLPPLIGLWAMFCCLFMWRCCIIACNLSLSLANWSSNCDTTCIWTRAWAVDLSSRVCSVFKCLEKKKYTKLDFLLFQIIYKFWNVNGLKMRVQNNAYKEILYQKILMLITVWV